MRPHRITYPALLLSALIASSTMAYGADERIDTLSSSKVSSSYGSIVVPQRIAGKELKASANISEAVRRFAGVQVRDYGGVGGLKTVNVRSLGSEHTGVFIDGIQVDNAQNMQVDLGRFSCSTGRKRRSCKAPGSTPRQVRSTWRQPARNSAGGSGTGASGSGEARSGHSLPD